MPISLFDVEGLKYDSQGTYIAWSLQRSHVLILEGPRRASQSEINSVLFFACFFSSLIALFLLLSVSLALLSSPSSFLVLSPRLLGKTLTVQVVFRENWTLSVTIFRGGFVCFFFFPESISSISASRSLISAKPCYFSFFVSSESLKNWIS